MDSPNQPTPIPAALEVLPDHWRHTILALDAAPFDCRLIGAAAEALYFGQSHSPVLEREPDVLVFRSNSNAAWNMDDLRFWAGFAGCDFAEGHGHDKSALSQPNGDGVSILLTQGCREQDLFRFAYEPRTETPVATKAELAFDVLRDAYDVTVSDNEDHRKLEWSLWDRVARMSRGWDEESLAMALVAARDFDNTADYGELLQDRPEQLGRKTFTLGEVQGYLREPCDVVRERGREGWPKGKDMSSALVSLADLGDLVASVQTKLADRNAVEYQAWSVYKTGQLVPTGDQSRMVQLSGYLQGRPTNDHCTGWSPRRDVDLGYHDLAWAPVHRSLRRELAQAREARETTRASAELAR